MQEACKSSTYLLTLKLIAQPYQLLLNFDIIKNVKYGGKFFFHSSFDLVLGPVALKMNRY